MTDNNNNYIETSNNNNYNVASNDKNYKVTNNITCNMTDDNKLHGDC